MSKNLNHNVSSQEIANFDKNRLRYTRIVMMMNRNDGSTVKCFWICILLWINGLHQFKDPKKSIRIRFQSPILMTHVINYVNLRLLNELNDCIRPTNRIIGPKIVCFDKKFTETNRKRESKCNALSTWQWNETNSYRFVRWKIQFERLYTRKRLLCVHEASSIQSIVDAVIVYRIHSWLLHIVKWLLVLVAYINATIGVYEIVKGIEWLRLDAGKSHSHCTYHFKCIQRCNAKIEGFLCVYQHHYKLYCLWNTLVAPNEWTSLNCFNSHST